jgi:hypothetical protein
MNANRLDTVKRIESLWNQMLLEISLSEQSKGSLCHLAVALFQDEEVRSALANVGLPTLDDLRLVLTDTEPLSGQFDKRNVPLGGSLAVVPGSSSHWYVGDSVFECVEHVLNGNTIGGREAHLLLLQHVLRDEEVRTKLLGVVDVGLLERTLAAALA